MKLRAPRFEELEARILYSADPLPGLVGFAPGIVEERHLLDNGEFAQVAAPATQAESADVRREVVFIDTGVPDWDLLLQDIRNGETEDRKLDVVLIDAQRDGVEQVTQALAGRNDVAALHFITHGEAGAMRLGNQWVDLSSLHDASDAVAQWGHSLTPDADILLYGCDVAQGERGEAFVQTLARLTGADVAASETVTGAAARGGDWSLEAHTGAIESAVAISADGQRNYGALLQSSPQGDETRANTTTFGPQDSNNSMPPRNVAMDASGNFVVVWHGDGPGDADGIYGQRFDANGVAQGGQFRINTGTAGVQNDPAMAMDANGNFVVAWTSTVGDGSGEVVLAQRYDSSGVAQGGEFRVNTTTLNDQGQPVIAMNLNGFVIAWSDSAQDGSLHGVFAQRYNAAGVAQGGEFVVTTTTLGDQWIDSAAMDASGNFIVTWSTEQSASGLDVYSRRFDSSGTPLSGEVLVNSTTTGEQSWSSVAMNGSGAHVVTWRHHDGINYDVCAQRYNAAGVAQGPEFRVNTSTTDQWPASVAIDGNGNFVVTWSSYDQDSPTTWGVYKQEYFANGSAASAELLVTTTTAGEQDWSSVVMNASGAYVVAWSGNGPGDANGIFFQRYVHNAPTITSNAGGATASINVAENTTAVTTVTASDADAGTTLSYSIVGGADAARFTINASTGALSFTSAPDREAPIDSGGNNVYDLTVQVSDGDLTDTQAIAVTVTNVNDNAPVITSFGGGASASLSIAENSTVAFGVSATDADAGTTLSYSIIGGADAAHFSINSSTGALDFGVHDHEAPTDADANNVHDVIVQASDGTLTDTQAIAVTVTNVNDNAPVITSGGGGANASLNVAENTTGVTIVTATDADASTAFDYSIIGGADSARFTINPTTGTLSFVAAPDRENPIDAGADNVYDVTVQVSDGAQTDTQAIAVTVTNVNDTTPVITSDGAGAGAALNVAENTSAVTTVTATDGDAATTLTYSIVGGVDAARFTINAGTGALSFVAAPDREAPIDSDANSVYDVVVQASDGALTDTQAIAVTVTNVNDNAPVISSDGGGATASVNAAENSTAVTTVSAGDADADSTLTYSIFGGADAARFTIDAATGVLAFVAAPDREGPVDADADNVYDVTVQASDGALTDTQAIAVAVTNVNDNTPVITSDGGGATAARSVAENGSAVTTVTATDADTGATLGYSIAGGADAARFTIDATTGVLSFAAAPNFEAPIDAGANNVYDVTVRVSDGSFNDTQAIAVTVTDVDDNAPVITSDGGGASAARSVAENGTAVTTVTATDADVSSAVSYSIVGGVDAARFTINATTGVFGFVAAPDFEAPVDSGANNVYDVVVQASDGALADTQAIAFTVTNLNDNTPVITSDGGAATAARNAAENGTAVTTVMATDADGGATLSYSIIGGADAARFTINAAAGTLDFVAAPDHEAPTDSDANNVYDVVVQVSDGSLADSQAIAVTVANVNDNAPTITSDGGGAAATVGIAENGTAVTTVTASDADAGAVLSYSIVGGADAASFSIDSATGMLSFIGAPNHEAPTDAGGDNVYDVTVQVSDGALIDSQAIAVAVTNVNDNTPVITSNGAGATAALSVAENSTAVTDVTAADNDAGATLSYSIVGGADAARFTIDGTTGALSFISPPNHEAPSDADADNVYDVTVRVTDGSFSDSQAIALTVLNVNEDAPVITSGAGAASTSVAVAENMNAVTTVTATDADAGAMLGYSIVGGDDAALFTIDATTGVLRFIAAPDFEIPADADADNVYHVVVQVSDAGLTDTQAITVIIGNMSEGPATTGDMPLMPSPSFAGGFGPGSTAAPAAPPAPASRERGPSAHPSAVASESPAPNAQRAITSTTRGLTGGSNFDRVTSREARATASAMSTSRKSSAATDATAGTLTERRVALDDFIAQAVDDTVLKLDGGFQLLAPQGSHRSSGGSSTSQGTPASQDDEPSDAMSIDIDTVRYAGVALSAGVVWWVTRAGGLVASMLATAPAWRHLDLLPVLAANDQREDVAEAVLETAEEQVAQDMLER